MGRRGFMAAVLAAGSGLAVSTFAARPSRAAMDGGADGARGFVIDLAHKAITVMADSSMADPQRVAKFRDLFVTSFDLLSIGQFVLGRHWRAASTEQQAQFLKLFERQQVLTWSNRFKYFNGQRIAIEAADAESGGDWLVESRVDSVNGVPIVVNWTVARSGDGWRVIDLSIAGVSLALTLRQDFAAVLSSNGGKFDALLSAMQSKIDQLSAG
jgi:phospholipid transport system substrate-binding protein